MKGYSSEIPENCAVARVEGVNASYKDLAEVCGRIRNKKSDWALEFLEKAAAGEVPILYKRHNRNLGHRRELGGQKGRYPEKAAQIVLKTLQSAIANGKSLGLGEVYTILAACANKKDTYPRMAPKGRTARSFLETSRVEIVLKGSDIPKGVSVVPPAKKTESARKIEINKDSSGKVDKSKGQEAAAVTDKKNLVASDDKEPVVGKTEGKEPQKILKNEQPQHKHEAEKLQDNEKKKEQPPHQHGEHNKR